MGVKETIIKESVQVQKKRSYNCITKGHSVPCGCGYLACDCIVSLQSVEGPFDVLTTEHSEVRHEQIGSLHHGLVSHLAQSGIVKQVLSHLNRPRAGS